ncbi:MAG: hypothetical protein EOP87_20845 [Verrucomicrobiaceae bacterium]|nr:MAG: hypothetical protein EOP87_20845 [Verrucomicrobiaceae bacterium]
MKGKQPGSASGFVTFPKIHLEYEFLFRCESFARRRGNRYGRGQKASARNESESIPLLEQVDGSPRDIQAGDEQGEDEQSHPPAEAALFSVQRIPAVDHFIRSLHLLGHDAIQQLSRREFLFRVLRERANGGLYELFADLRHGSI